MSVLSFTIKIYALGQNLGQGQNIMYKMEGLTIWNLNANYESPKLNSSEDIEQIRFGFL